MKTVSAGEVLTVSLLKKVDKAAYQHGGFEIIGNREFKIVDKKPIWVVPTVIIPEKFLKSDVASFMAAFEKTMNAFHYRISII